MHYAGDEIEFYRRIWLGDRIRAIEQVGAAVCQQSNRLPVLQRYRPGALRQPAPETAGVEEDVHGKKAGHERRNVARLRS